MARVNDHIIHRQRVLIRAGDSRVGLDLQQAAGRVFWGRILPRLERLFDQYSSPEEVLRIERLEIDLGRCGVDELEGVLEKRFLESVELELQRLNARPSSEDGVERQRVPESQVGQWLFFLEHGSLPWSAIPDRQERVFEETVLLDTLAATPLLRAALLRLLGRAAAARRRLVLQYRDAFLAELSAGLADTPAAAFTAAATALAEELPKLYKTYPDLFVGRAADVLQSPSLLRQLFWEWVLRRIAKGEAVGWAAVFGGLLKGLLLAAVAQEIPVLPPAPSPADWLRQWGMAAVAAARMEAKREGELSAVAREAGQAADEEGKEAVPTPPIADQERGQSGEKEAGTAEKPANDDLAERDAAPAAAEGSPSAEHEIGSRSDGQPDNNKVLDEARDLKTPVRPDAASSPEMGTEATTAGESSPSADLGETLDTITGEQPLSPDAETPTGTVHYLSDAGLVLLHPFFPPLFKELGYMEGKVFRSFSAQTRAAHLLHFMAGGTAQPPEYRLLLPKLLCGLPLNAPIAQLVELDENERTEAIALMEAAIRHWGALGNASPGGLREGFLQREGKLEKRADGWRLTVERKTIDVLLDRLPWGVGMVGLPWMGEVVWVEWR